MNSTHQGPKAEEIKNLFGSISKTYDLANDVMTFGLARKWRKQVVQWSDAKKGDHILDCATGTGDLAFDFKRSVGVDGHVVGSDFCEGMLERGPEKAKKLNLQVNFEVADATNLPYEDNTFDVTSIAYGIRNVNDPVKALSEMARVTKPGGRVMILETGEVQNPILSAPIQLYFKHIVPRLGGLVSGNRDAYEYLNRSSSQFPCREKFLDLMTSTQQFAKVDYKTLMGGASFIYRGLVR